MNYIFDNKLIENVTDGVPSFSFQFFHLCHIGVFGLYPLFWLQMIVLVLTQTVLNVGCAILIYTQIIKKQGTGLSYLVGYGIVCPFLVVMPFCMIRWLEIQNVAIQIASSAGPSLLFFRVIEAMYGTVPSFSTKNMKTFVLYYAATIQFTISKSGEVVPLTLLEVRRKSMNFLSLFFQVSMLYSILIPRNFEIFPRGEETSLLYLFYPTNLFNNYIMACLTSTCLEVGATGVGLAISLLTGISTVDLNFSPLSKSSSPSDFWGQRWNTLVSSALKRAIFVPLRSRMNCSRPLAALITFVVSGLFHEYVLIVMAFRANDHTPIRPMLSGNHLLFFAWNGVVLILEPIFAHTRVVHWISRTFPARIKTILVVLTVLPVAHLFTDEYVNNGFYGAFSMGFPRLMLNKLQS